MSKPKKEDYMECNHCHSFIPKEKITEDFFGNKECPVCGNNILIEGKKDDDEKE